MTITTYLATNLAAIVLYLGGAAYQISLTAHRRNSDNQWLMMFAISALLFHAVGSYPTLAHPQGVDLGFFKVGSLIFWVINVLVLISGMKKPLHTLFIFLFPLSAMALLAATFSNSSDRVALASSEVIAHVMLSILAYSLMFIAALQAITLAYQNYQLKHKHPGGLIRLLPPLQTMESLLFELLAVGQLALTGAIVTGFIFIDDVFAQHLAHKTVFSLSAWIIYAVLLWGHYRLGWRGNTAVRWTLVGCCALMLAYFGSKFVLEIVLS